MPRSRVPSEKCQRGQRKWAYQMTVLDSEGNAAASYFAPERSTGAIEKLPKRAKAEAGFSPDIVVTDGYNAYEQGLKVLGRRTEHIRVPSSGSLSPMATASS